MNFLPNSMLTLLELEYWFWFAKHVHMSHPHWDTRCRLGITQVEVELQHGLNTNCRLA